MSLYVKVLNSFYTNRKTLRLRAAIGNDAFWVPPRLWAYASENQPDGCFSGYAPEELAMLVAYSGDAQALLKALLQAGFLDPDPLRIHAWDEHNGYHSFYAERAKVAAGARWGKGKDKRREEASIPSSNASSITKASCDIPSWEEFWSFCQLVGMASEYYARDKFLAAEADHWDRKGNWKAYVTRFKGWWESEGRPMKPKTAGGNPGEGQFRKKPPKPHVDCYWSEPEWRWIDNPDT